MVQVNLTGPDYREAVNTQDPFLIEDAEREYKNALDDINSLNTLIKIGGQIVDEGAEAEYNAAMVKAEETFLGAEAVSKVARESVSLDEKSGLLKPTDLAPAAKGFDAHFDKMIADAPFIYRHAMGKNRAKLKRGYLGAVADLAVNERDIALSNLTFIDVASGSSIADAQRQITHPGLRDSTLQKTGVQLAQKLLSNLDTLDLTTPANTQRVVDRVNAMIGGDEGLTNLNQASVGAIEKHRAAVFESWLLSDAAPTSIIDAVIDGPAENETYRRKMRVAIRAMPDGPKKERLKRFAEAGFYHGTNSYSAHHAGALVEAAIERIRGILSAGEQGAPGAYDALNVLIGTISAHPTGDMPISQEARDSLTQMLSTTAGQVPEARKILLQLISNTTELVGQRAGGAGSLVGAPEVSPSVFRGRTGGLTAALMEDELIPEGGKYDKVDAVSGDWTPETKAAFTNWVISKSMNDGGSYDAALFRNQLAKYNMLLEKGDLTVLRHGRNFLGLRATGLDSDGEGGNDYYDEFGTGMIYNLGKFEFSQEPLAIPIKRVLQPNTAAVPDPPQAGDATGDIPVDESDPTLAPHGQGPARLKKGEEALNESPEQTPPADGPGIGDVYVGLGISGAVIARITQAMYKNPAIQDALVWSFEQLLADQGNPKVTRQAMRVLRNGSVYEIREFFRKRGNKGLGAALAKKYNFDLRMVSEVIYEPDEVAEVLKRIRKDIMKDAWQRFKTLKSAKAVFSRVLYRYTLKPVVHTGPAYLWNLLRKEGPGLLKKAWQQGPRAIGKGILKAFSIPLILTQLGVEYAAEKVGEHRERGDVGAAGRWELSPQPGQFPEDESHKQDTHRIAVAYDRAAVLQAGGRERQGVASGEDVEHTIVGIGAVIPDVVGWVRQGQAAASNLFLRGELEPVEGILGNSTDIGDQFYNDRVMVIPQELAEYISLRTFRGSQVSGVQIADDRVAGSDVFFSEESFNQRLRRSQRDVTRDGAVFPGSEDISHVDPEAKRREFPFGRIAHTQVEWNPNALYVHNSDGRGLGLDLLMAREAGIPGASEAFDSWNERWGGPMREALELARGFTSGGLPSEILNNLTPEGEKAKKRHTEYPEDSATDIEGNLLDTPLPSRGLTPDSAINVLVAQGMPVQEAADLLTLQDMLSDEGSDGYFKTPMPFQDGESPLVSVVGLTVKGDFSIQWSLKPNEQVPHFIAYQTMKRMHEESQKTFLEDYMEPWTDAVPTNPLEWTAKNAEDWAEFQQLALNDDAMPGWIDQDEWDEMAVEVASNMKKWWGVDLGDTNSTVAPGLRLQRSLHVDEELAGVRETISRLEGLEYDSLGPLGDLVGDILSGSSATQHPLLHKSAQKRVNRRETHKMVRELSDLVNKAYEQAGLPLKQRDPEWEVRYARYEKRDALEEKKGGGRYSPLGGIEGQVLLVKPPGYDVWIPVSRARDALKTVNRIIMLRSIEDRLGSIDQRPDA